MWIFFSIIPFLLIVVGVITSSDRIAIPEVAMEEQTPSVPRGDPPFLIYQRRRVACRLMVIWHHRRFEPSLNRYHE
jgi:hypothetical protein